MINYETISINFTQITRFISVVELSSFTKAAERHNLTQPVISKSMSSLEKTLNIQLFIRNKGKIQLTPSGTLLYDFWKVTLPMFEKVHEKAYILQKGYSSQLIIGIHSLYNPKYFLVPILASYRGKYKDISLFPKSYSFSCLRNRVLSGNIDVAFTSLREADDIREQAISDIVVKDLIFFPVRVIMLATNPLCKHDSLTVGDLKNQRFVVYSPREVPTYHTTITNMCMKAGFIPKEYDYIEDASSFGLSLMDDDQVYIVDRAAVIDEALNLKGFDLEGTRSGVSLIWNAQNINPALQMFINECDEYFHNNPDPYSDNIQAT